MNQRNYFPEFFAFCSFSRWCNIPETVENKGILKKKQFARNPGNLFRFSGEPISFFRGTYFAFPGNLFRPDLGNP